jgi:CheY-like chemotaxis protein
MGAKKLARRFEGLVAVYIEDNEQIRSIVHDQLKLAGIIVVEAASGRTGLQEIMRHQPDLVLLDWMLPDGNGLEVCRRLRANRLTAETPIIMISADHSIFETAMAAGVTFCIGKPFDLDKLIAEIERLFSHKLVIGDSASSSADPYAEIGKLHGKRPEYVLPALMKIPRTEWRQAFEKILKSNQPKECGQAVIALANWHQEPDAPLNRTAGQRAFWQYIRHGIASNTPEEAIKHCSLLSNVALALIYSPETISRAVQRYCLRHEYWGCRSWALRILMENDDPYASDAAAEGLSDKHGEVRSTAAMVLAKHGTAPHVLILTQTLNDREAGVREQAAHALANIRADSAGIALETTLLQGKVEAAQAAAYGLSTRGTEDSLEALIQAVREREEPAVLRQVAHALGRLMTPKTRRVLIEMRNHPDEGVRDAVKQYLKL